MNTLWKLPENHNIAGKILLNEPMSVHTTFRTGGAADLFIIPDTEVELISNVNELTRHGIPSFILGGGSNLLVADGGIDGAVISTAMLGGVGYEGGDTSRIRVEAGCPIEKLTSWCLAESRAGLESFAGLPGTAGGALYMNARCYGSSFSDTVESVTYFNTDTQMIEKYLYNSDDWDYKKSPFQNPCFIVLSAVLRVTDGDSAGMRAKMDECVADRTSKGHFRFPSAGSVFKNNREFGKPSGKIIDEAGLLGYRIGGAQIAPWHGNFIINLGDASSSDIRALIDYTIETVRERAGYVLEPEVLCVGRW